MDRDSEYQTLGKYTLKNAKLESLYPLTPTPPRNKAQAWMSWYSAVGGNGCVLLYLQYWAIHPPEAGQILA